MQSGTHAPRKGNAAAFWGNRQSISGRPHAISYARLAPSLVNTPEEVERAIRAVREVSG